MGTNYSMGSVVLTQAILVCMHNLNGLMED